MTSTNAASASTNILVKQSLIASLDQIAANLLKIFHKFVCDLLGGTGTIDQKILPFLTLNFDFQHFQKASPFLTI